jgi:hypothetical protein
MEYNFFNVRVGTRTKAGNLNVIHSFVCKSLEEEEYKISDFYRRRYSGFNIDVFPINEIVEAPIDLLQKEPFKSYKSESNKKIKDLELEIKKLQESKNSTFLMEVDNSELNEANQLLYTKVVEDYKVYSQSVDDLENGIKSQIMEKYSPFASSVFTDERMNGNNRIMKFRLNLKARLF